MLKLRGAAPGKRHLELQSSTPVCALVGPGDGKLRFDSFGLYWKEILYMLRDQ
jgi:hypothetical protein